MFKTITVTEDAFGRIKAMKKTGESFSELFVRITEEKKGDIRKFFGTLKSENEMGTERARWEEARRRLSKELEQSINARS